MTAVPTGGRPERDVWPFLVAPGIRRGVRVVVAPDFLCAAGDADVVFDAASTGPRVGEGRTNVVTVPSRSGEMLTLIFQRVPALAEEVGVVVTGDLPAGPGPVALYDVHGRPITLIEGIVVRDTYTGLSLGQDEWRKLHENLLTGYRRFLEDETGAFAPVPSERMSLTVGGTPVAPVPVRPARDRRSQSGSVTLLGAVICFAIMVVILVVLVH
jgi:hypothetical protein